MSTTSFEKVNGTAVAEPRFDPVALAEADAVRARAAAETKARIIEAEGKAKAAQTLAVEEAEKQRLANERAAMRLEKEKADHQAYLAKKAAEKARLNAEKEKAEQADAEREAEEAALAREQQRSEKLWKWGAYGIYAVGLIIAAPVQFMHFWDRERPFLVAAPALLEGLALVLAFGAAWAVAHRRDVAPYRVGIMLGALVAAGINLYGAQDPRIGFNAGLIGAIASLGGPIVLMAYEHGIAQQADGIPSRRERRAAARAKRQADAAREKAQRDKRDAEHAAKADKQLAEARALEDQKRRDEDRRQHHPEVWQVADALRSARGSQYVTEQIWAEAWQRVTGCKTVGITLDIETASRVQQARVKALMEMPIEGPLSLVNSHRPLSGKKDPNAPDGRRNNGGTPPLRRSGDSAPISPIARTQARLERTATEEQS